MARILRRIRRLPENIATQEQDRKPLRGEGKFEIFQSKANLMMQLESIEKAGRTCYRSETKSISSHTADAFIRMILKRGHESVIEHSLITVKFTNVSRGFTHEMVRHRICAFSQESTRFVDYAGGKLDLEEAELGFVMPPHRKDFVQEVEGISLNAACAVEGYERVYKRLRSAGWAPQDARQFLPIGICSSIVVSTNYRQWRHMFAMRTQKAAHWEIRYMMCDLLSKLKTIIPVIFEDFTNLDADGNLLLDADGYMYYEKVDRG